MTRIVGLLVKVESGRVEPSTDRTMDPFSDDVCTAGVGTV